MLLLLVKLYEVTSGIHAGRVCVVFQCITHVQPCITGMILNYKPPHLTLTFKVEYVRMLLSAGSSSCMKLQVAFMPVEFALCSGV